MDLSYSKRFRKNIRLTTHASTRMAERGVSEHYVLDLVESGNIKFKDKSHLWIYKSYADRPDNNICAAAVVGDALVVKTIMTNWHENET